LFAPVAAASEAIVDDRAVAVNGGQIVLAAGTWSEMS
jgi:hypothetical protein